MKCKSCGAKRTGKWFEFHERGTCIAYLRKRLHDLLLRSRPN